MFKFVFWIPYSWRRLLYNHVPQKQTVKTCAPIKKQTIHNALRPEDLGLLQPHHPIDAPKLKQIRHPYEKPKEETLNSSISWMMSTWSPP